MSAVPALPALIDATALTAGLRAHLDGQGRAVREHFRELYLDLLAPPLTPLPMQEHRARITAQLAALAGESFVADGFPERQGGHDRYGDAVIAFEMLGHADLSLFVKAGVQWGLFGGAVSLLGTERHDALVPRIISGELQGCFAMSETGHGSDVQGLLTTATSPPSSPSSSSASDDTASTACSYRSAPTTGPLPMASRSPTAARSWARRG